MSTVRRRFAVVLVAFLGTGGAVGATGPAVAAPAPGAVLAATTGVALPAPLGDLATGTYVQYASTDVNGGSITATGLVLSPKQNKKNKTVVWAHGTTGLADRCAPSTNQEVFWPEALDAVAGLLRSGWTVAAPDYPGLGTSQPHPYLVGESEARAIIDSVKAARNLDRALSTQYVVDGHSQGGQGALFAGQIAPTYDGALVLRGVVAIAPVSNITGLAQLIPGTPGQGYLVMGLAGLAAVERSLNPLEPLAPEARSLLPVLQSGCLYQILDAYSGLSATQLLNGGALPPRLVSRLVYWDEPAQVAPTAPILVVQGTFDETVPADFTAALVRRLRDYQTVPVRVDVIDGANHDQAVTQSVNDVNNWVTARFA